MTDPTWSADSDSVIADSGLFTADGGVAGLIPAGWPCALLAADPPSVADLQSSPSADDFLPQVLALTPRGPAWGTDEAGDGRGASPVQRGFWRGVAAWAADWNARAFDLATQALPSAISWSLADWEREYGLPDACLSGQGGSAARVANVRARFAGVGGSSPAYFVCLAQSIGYTITVDEPTQFMVDVSEVVGDPLGETWFVPDASLLDDGGVTETWFVCDDGVIGDDGSPLESFALTVAADGDVLEGFSIPVDLEPGDEVAGGIVEDWLTCDDGEIGDDGVAVESFDQDPNGSVWKFWVVRVQSLGETWFRIDEGEIDTDPLQGFLPASDLECLLRRAAPTHTQLIFDYVAV